MKIVVIGGSGLIGSKLVTKLREHGHEAIAASPHFRRQLHHWRRTGGVLEGAAVVVDVTNSPSWEDAAVMEFFETSTRNLLAYEAAAGVRHHVALSVVGTERLLASGFFRAKMAQENLVKDFSIPYTIIRATQFFEFVKGIADISLDGGKVASSVKRAQLEMPAAATHVGFPKPAPRVRATRKRSGVPDGHRCLRRQPRDRSEPHRATLSALAPIRPNPQNSSVTLLLASSIRTIFPGPTEFLVSTI